ncbi:nuclear pore complex protein NUP88 [Typha angustifolia]|uniref:nuclear pore complex protein NUP88 n=1 Tax=Typha angustifolia TaxID=59011 RepID=UPI003C2DDBD2
MTILAAPPPPSSPPPSDYHSPPPPSLSPLILSSRERKKNPLEWVPLPKHPVFANRSPNLNLSPKALPSSPSGFRSQIGGGGDGSSNLAAWDPSASRFYLWDPNSRCVHRLSLRFRDLGADSSSSSPDDVVVEAAVPSEKLMPDIQLPSPVRHVSLNLDGSSLLLAGSDSLSLIYIYERTSATGDTIICRTVPVASKVLAGQNNGLQTLQTLWHPFSSSHLGVLTSDSVFRLYDLSSDRERPEQEYYLQPVQPGRCQNAASICPVAFSYGSHHLWDRFSVFILFSDGSVYILCPVVPFGSLFNSRYIQDIYEDLNAFGLKSTSPRIISNSRMAIAWLEATFPEVADQSTEGRSVAISRAHPYSPVDASLSLQGPLCRVCRKDENNVSEGQSSDGCKGRSVSFLYSSIGKDSVLVTAWSSGQIQIDALADEIQPQWSIGISPHLDVDSLGHIKGVAMICESNSQDLSTSKLHHPLNIGSNMSTGADTVLFEHSPPLLRLAIVDLALPDHNCMLSLFHDPLVSERFYCVHGGGIDVVTLHFLPFSDANTAAKPPSVHPILTAANDESCSPFLCGFLTIADSYGHLQVVGVTFSYECIQLEMKGWKEPLPFHYEIDDKSVYDTKATIPEFISKELLAGPKVITLPASTSLRSVTADSIEGRSTLHHYIKLFHENYVEYAHKVYIELKEHAGYLKTVIDDQQKRLHATKQLLKEFNAKDQVIEGRIDRAFKVYELLEKRLQSFKTLPAANKKPLSRAEREFKAQLDRFADVELDALHMSIEALKARMRRHSQPSPAQPPSRGRNYVPEAQMSTLKMSLERLSILNEENTQKLNLIEHELNVQGK